MEPFSIRSEWSSPAAGLAGRAFDHHLTDYAAWLTSAGAEPRLAIVLCAGPGARDRFAAGLDFDRVDVVHAPATPARPLHPKLLAHQGNHFNTTLYLVDGFEAGDPAELFAALDGRVGVLTGTATWVAIVIESLDALAALYQRAPRIAAEARRRVLVVGDPPKAGDDPVPPALRARWQRDNRVAERVFHHLATPTAPPDPIDFGRLVRCGYVEAVVGAAGHPERQRLAALWQAGDGPLPFPAAQAGPVAALEALRRLGDRLSPADRATLAATLTDPDDRLVAGVETDGVHGALAHLAAVGRGEASGGPALITRLDGLLDGAAPALRAHGQQAIAAAAAALGDLDRCEKSLAAAADAARAAGLIELWFDVTEKQVQIHAWLDRRARAREALDQLEALTPALCSPFYAARLRLARGEFLAPLDAARAAEELHAAERLFTAHGYPEWAELAADGTK